MAYETVSSVKSYLGITDTSYDYLISAGITYCSELVDEWSLRSRVPGATLGQAFLTHQASNTWFLDGQNGVLLPEWPIQSIVSVKDDDVVVASDKYILFDSGWLQFLDASDKMPLPRWGKIEITWNGGFTTAPAGVSQFIFRGVDYLIQRRMHEGISADLLGDTQVTFRSAKVANKATTELRDLFNDTAAQYTLDYLFNIGGGEII